MNAEQTTTIVWGDDERSFNCKITISADEILNGKLTLEVIAVEQASAYIYLLPNVFNTELSDTIGILENNLVYSITSEYGKISVPTDWSMIVSYNTDNDEGTISIKTYAEEYTADDVESIAGDWQPTGTEYIDPAIAAAEEATREAQEEADRLALELLESQLR